jgi:hypothetical protein
MRRIKQAYHFVKFLSLTAHSILSKRVNVPPYFQIELVWTVEKQIFKKCVLIYGYLIIILDFVMCHGDILRCNAFFINYQVVFAKVYLLGELKIKVY